MTRKRRGVPQCVICHISLSSTNELHGEHPEPVSDPIEPVREFNLAETLKEGRKKCKHGVEAMYECQECYEAPEVEQQPDILAQYEAAKTCYCGEDLMHSFSNHTARAMIEMPDLHAVIDTLSDTIRAQQATIKELERQLKRIDHSGWSDSFRGQP